MSEKLIMIPGDDLSLEALYAQGILPDTAILCHPHPLYGGDMHNNVVVALRDTLKNLGWGTLRFNFRGVGRSGGQYDHGKGESEDILFVHNYLVQSKSTLPHIVGYSFGGWVALKAIQNGLSPKSFILISPPIDFLDFQDLSLPSAPTLILSGNRDEFCQEQSLRKWLEQQSFSLENATFHTLPHCNHFFWGHEHVLSKKVTDFIEEKISPRGVGKTDGPSG